MLCDKDWDNRWISLDVKNYASLNTVEFMPSIRLHTKQHSGLGVKTLTSHFEGWEFNPRQWQLFSIRAQREKICCWLCPGIRKGNQPVNAKLHSVTPVLSRIKELKGHKKKTYQTAHQTDLVKDGIWEKKLVSTSKWENRESYLLVSSFLSQGLTLPWGFE